MPRARLGRAATFAFGAGIVGATALVACSGETEDPGPSTGGTAGAAGATTGGASAGGSANTGGSNNSGGASTGGTGMVPDDGGVQPLYGGSPVYGAPP